MAAGIPSRSGKTMREPSFWWRTAGAIADMLSPIGAIYGTAVAMRMARPGRAVPIPVICVGNLTLGGAGKTPTAIAVAQILRAAGRQPYFLSRGYGGTAAREPTLVDPAHHRAQDVGDEPLLLARIAPTMVARDRFAGAAVASRIGADTIVMDDGFQNPGLYKNRSILVVDGARGIGNGRVFPAGPLRAPLAPQLARAHGLLLVGEGEAGEQVATAARANGLPVFHGRLEPDGESLAGLRGQRVLAFAGIGHPEKFFTTLRIAGIEVAATSPFPDHHRYRRAEAQELIERAEREGLVPVTTEKDLARLSGQEDVAVLAKVVRVLPVRLVVSEDAAFRHWVLG